MRTVTGPRGWWPSMTLAAVALIASVPTPDTDPGKQTLLIAIAVLVGAVVGAGLGIWALRRRNSGR